MVWCLWLSLALATDPPPEEAGGSASEDATEETPAEPADDSAAPDAAEQPPAEEGSPEQAPAKEPWLFRGEVGAEIGEAPFGVVTVGFKWKALTLQWLTDTLDVRWAPETEHGRWWVAARGEFGAANLMLARWEDGRRAPELDLLAFYEGVEAGGVAYLPGGLYAGAQGLARWWHFAALPGTERDVLAGRPVVTLDAVLGLWHPMVHVWVRGGSDWSVGGFSPHVHGTLVTDFPWIVRPKLELRGGWADNTDEVLATRLGGLNPYVVPLAGAAWAEFLVEDYAAARLGPEVGRDVWHVFLVGDVAWFDGRLEGGLAAGGGWEDRGRFVRATLGWSPWLERPGSVAMTAWVIAGVTWGKGLSPRPE